MSANKFRDVVLPLLEFLPGWTEDPDADPHDRTWRLQLADGQGRAFQIWVNDMDMLAQEQWRFSVRGVYPKHPDGVTLPPAPDIPEITCAVRPGAQVAARQIRTRFLERYLSAYAWKAAAIERMAKEGEERVRVMVLLGACAATTRAYAEGPYKHGMDITFQGGATGDAEVTHDGGKVKLVLNRLDPAVAAAVVMLVEKSGMQ